MAGFACAKALRRALLSAAAAATRAAARLLLVRAHAESQPAAPGRRHERMFAPIAGGFVLVDTEGWFWIRTVGAPRDGDPRDGELHQSTRDGATFAAT